MTPQEDTHPSGDRGVAALLQLRVCGEVVPHNAWRVVLVPQLGAALEEEVNDEELDAGIQPC